MGMAPSVVIYDELGQSESRDLLDALDTAMGKRAEPLMIVISTQAARDEAPLSQLIDYGLRIRPRRDRRPVVSPHAVHGAADADPWNSVDVEAGKSCIGRFSFARGRQAVGVASAKNAERRSEFS